MLKKSNLVLITFLMTMSGISLAKIKTCDELLDTCAGIVHKQIKLIKTQEELIDIKDESLNINKNKNDQLKLEIKDHVKKNKKLKSDNKELKSDVKEVKKSRVVISLYSILTTILLFL